MSYSILSESKLSYIVRDASFQLILDRLSGFRFVLFWCSNGKRCLWPAKGGKQQNAFAPRHLAACSRLSLLLSHGSVISAPCILAFFQAKFSACLYDKMSTNPLTAFMGTFLLSRTPAIKEYIVHLLHFHFSWPYQKSYNEQRTY